MLASPCGAESGSTGNGDQHPWYREEERGREDASAGERRAEQVKDKGKSNVSELV